MPNQIDVKVTKPQNKHGQGRTRKFPIVLSFYSGWEFDLMDS